MTRHIPSPVVMFSDDQTYVPAAKPPLAEWAEEVSADPVGGTVDPDDAAEAVRAGRGELEEPTETTEPTADDSATTETTSENQTTDDGEGDEVATVGKK